MRCERRGGRAAWVAWLMAGWLFGTPAPAVAQSEFTTPCTPDTLAHRAYRTQDSLLVVANGTSAPTIYIGVEHKGVYVSLDGGATWTRRSNGIISYRRTGSESEYCFGEPGRMAVDPSNANHVYLLTVNSPGLLGESGNPFGGIYKSTDGARNWTQLTGYTNAGGGHALAVRAGAQTPTVFIGSANNLASWTNAPERFYNTTGVIYRSPDGGGTWTELDQRAVAGVGLIDEHLGASQLYIDATGQKLWMPAFVRSRTGAAGEHARQVAYLESTDGGDTWFRGTSRIPDVTARAGLDGSVAPANFNNRIYIATNAPAVAGGPMDLQSSWYTLDGGTTWARTNRYVYVARHSPHDPRGLTAFGYDPFSGAPGTPGQGILKTVDGGATWTVVSDLPSGVDNSTTGVRVSHFAFHPTDPNTIYAAGSMAHIWRSTDGGATWTTLLTLDHPTLGGLNTTTPTPPGAPGRPAVVLSAQTATLTWTLPTQGGLASSFTVDVAGDAQFTSVVSTATPTQASASVTLSSLSQAHYVRVRGVRANVGTGPASETLVIPARPTSVQALRFSATKQGASGAVVALTPLQTMTVGLGAGVAWTATTTTPWISLDSAGASGPGRLGVSVVNPGNVIAGQTSLSGRITVSADSVGITVEIPVTLTVDQTTAATAAPIGVFDTPIQGSTVSGSIAVTGWALDDVGVNRVEIWRDRIVGDPAPPFLETGHPANGKVFVANSTFVEGTRPDIESGYSTYPANHRGGWGYLLLTWGFPNSNGTFVLTAIAWDQEGKHTVLGTKTITVNNATATKPFGSIDVPAYGATFSGHNFTFGWALTPASGCTVSGGSRTMTIDSVPATGSTPYGITYGSARSDIAASFPGFSDSLAAGGAAALDSRTYANGTYQIGWLVYDSCGNGEGIGSRFFTILNSGSDAGVPRTEVRGLLRSTESHDARTSQEPRDFSPGGSLVIRGHGPTFARVGEVAGTASSPRTEVRGLLRSTELHEARLSQEPRDFSPGGSLWLIRGLGELERPIAPGATVWLSQTGRIEIHATRPGVVPMSGVRYEGYLVVDGVLRSLPLGSSFDARTGSFYWQPVAGFFGRYSLRIDQMRGTTVEQIWDVPIEVGPEGDAPLLQIDRATCSTELCLLQGWALDPQSADGAGIGHVHVWAERSAGAPECRGADVPGCRGAAESRFLGAAELGVARPDVAARYGAQFASAGYSLQTTGLSDGEWVVTVYAWNIRTARWDMARQMFLAVGGAR